MKHILLLLAISATTGLTAQPTLTAADLTPVFGTSVRYDSILYVPPGPVGANFTIDIANIVNITPQDTNTVQAVAPSNTPYGATFSAATYALAFNSYSDVGYSYMSVDPVSLQDRGSEVSGSGIFRSNGILDIQLPCTMGTSWTDTFNGSDLSSSSTAEENGTLIGQCNGYGTLILPYGTFTNVLRIELQEFSTRTDQGGDTTTFFNNSISYFAPGIPYVLLRSSSGSSSTNGGPALTYQSSVVFGVTSDGIAERGGPGTHALLFPNPANNEITIAFSAPVSKGTTINLLDATGRKVCEMDQDGTLANGATIKFDVSSVPRGMYIVRVLDAHGRSSNMPLVLR